MLNATEIREEFDSVKTKYSEIFNRMNIDLLISSTGTTRTVNLGRERGYVMYLNPSALEDRTSVRKEISAEIEYLKYNEGKINEGKINERSFISRLRRHHLFSALARYRHH